MKLEHRSVTQLLIPIVPNPERYRGAVIDREKAREVPITDEMVMHACEALEQVRYPFRESVKHYSFS